MRQDYSKQILQAILNQYPKIGAIEDFKLFTSGFENSNYYVKTSQGEYVIKIYEGMGMNNNNIKFEIEVMDACHQAGCKTPHILKNKNGELYIYYEKKIAIVMHFIPGKNVDKKHINNETAYTIGQQTGKMDQALSKFPDNGLTRQNYEFDGKTFLQLEKKVKYLPDYIDKKIINSIFKSFREIEKHFKKLPTGLIHNDICLHNIIVRNNKLACIIDFSDMAFSPYIQNISVPMSQLIFTYNWQPQQATLLIKGYIEHRPLSGSELDVLYIYTLSRYAISIIEFNYWNIKFGADNQRTKHICDTYDFIKKFLTLGKRQFNNLINL
ncbi:phosphotransferase [Patescibacteria group bacterium]|nr:phosphotransferase [Patescibacteria group bacterium]